MLKDLSGHSPLVNLNDGEIQEKCEDVFKGRKQIGAKAAFSTLTFAHCEVFVNFCQLLFLQNLSAMLNRGVKGHFSRWKTN